MRHKAKNRYTSELARVQFAAVGTGGQPERKLDRLKDGFARAAGRGRAEGEDGRASDGLRPSSESKVRRYGRRRR